MIRGRKPLSICNPNIIKSTKIHWKIKKEKKKKTEKEERGERQREGKRGRTEKLYSGAVQIAN